MTQVKAAAKVGALNATNVPKLSKEDKFIELAQKRVARAMLAMRSVGKLAVRRSAYTPEQVDRLVNALQGELDAVYSDFTSKGADKKVTFTL